MLDASPARAVLSTKPEYFGNEDASEIIDGEFRVLGKVIRSIATDSEQSINLLRKTSFGHIDNKIFDQLGEAFVDGLTPNERTTSAYATAVSSIVACSYSDGLR